MQTRFGALILLLSATLAAGQGGVCWYANFTTRTCEGGATNAVCEAKARSLAKGKAYWSTRELCCNAEFGGKCPAASTGTATAGAKATAAPAKLVCFFANFNTRTCDGAASEAVCKANARQLAKGYASWDTFEQCCSTEWNGKCATTTAKEVTASTRTPAATTNALASFKAAAGRDIVGQDIACGSDKFCKVCGGAAAVATACRANARCVAFTFGGDKDCGYLKSGTTASATTKGWTAYTK